MILQKTVTIKIGPQNISYWKSKGYAVEGIGISIEVSVNDLSKKSNVYVKCQCDKCKQPFENRLSRNTDMCSSCSKIVKLAGNNNGKHNQKYDIPSGSLLRQLHFEEMKSIEDIRKQFNVSRTVVERWFQHHDIESLNFLKRMDIPSKELLYELHIEKKMTRKELVKYFKTSPSILNNWLKDYEIEITKHKRILKPQPDLDLLKEMHFDEKKTLKDISKLFNVSDSLVGTWFREHEIDINCYSGGKSNAENELRDIINSWGFDFVKTRKVLSNNKELDMYCEKKKFAIEYCGLYWHSEQMIGKNYHLEKLKECEKLGITLITIFEDEWISKPEIVLSILRNKLGISNKIAARKCKFVSIEKKTANAFLKRNHIRGQVNSITHSFGLEYKNELIGVITFGKHHRGNDVTVLNRLCFMKNCSIIGGASKLFKNAMKEINQPVVSWSDKRWSEGAIYQVLGFDKTKTNKPDYSYWKNQRRHSKQSMKKSAVGCPQNIKEMDFNRNKGFGIIWDCGKDVWYFEP